MLRRLQHQLSARRRRRGGSTPRGRSRSGRRGSLSVSCILSLVTCICILFPYVWVVRCASSCAYAVAAGFGALCVAVSWLAGWLCAWRSWWRWEVRTLSSGDDERREVVRRSYKPPPPAFPRKTQIPNPSRAKRKRLARSVRCGTRSHARCAAQHPGPDYASSW